MNAFISYVHCYIIVSYIAKAVQVSHLTLSHNGMIHYRVMLGLICNVFTICFFQKDGLCFVVEAVCACELFLMVS